jgi:predicted Ser/Thr protein kinase
MDERTYEKYRQKFIDEAQTLARLNHPNVVKVVDTFAENNTAYIVMPFVDGLTLQQMVTQRGRLDYETTVNYIAQLTDAVDYIHRQNILHRDIKPDNIIITPHDKAILIDFGSAREFINDTTQSHTAILTPGYAPVEQYSSISRKGSYSDIYSLGAVFYFALTGKKPMDANARMLEKMPEPQALIPDIPTEANRTIMKAMQLKPEDRHQTVQAFMNDLLNVEKTPKPPKIPKPVVIKQPEPVIIKTPKPIPEPIVRQPKRHHTGLWITISAIVIFLSIFAVVRVVYVNEQEEKVIKQLQEEQPAEAAKAQQEERVKKEQAMQQECLNHVQKGNRLVAKGETSYKQAMAEYTKAKAIMEKNQLTDTFSLRNKITELSEKINERFDYYVAKANQVLGLGIQDLNPQAIDFLKKALMLKDDIAVQQKLNEL